MNTVKPHIDKGKGEVIILLHGLFGALSNWKSVVDFFSKKYRVIIPKIPLTDVDVEDANLESLTKLVSKFIKSNRLKNFTLIGNSLGGHIGLMYTIQNPNKVKQLVLTGSSGLYENSFGGSFPKRGNYEYMKERVEYTFYDPKTATQELVQEVFDITNDIGKCLRIVAIAKSAQRHNMREEIKNIHIPTRNKFCKCAIINKTNIEILATFIDNTLHG